MYVADEVTSYMMMTVEVMVDCGVVDDITNHNVISTINSSKIRFTPVNMTNWSLWVKRRAFLSVLNARSS